MEIGAGVRDKFLVRGMIDRFDRSNVLHQPRLMTMDVLDELRFRVRRPRDQDRLRVGQRGGYAVKKRLILRRVT